MKPTTHPVQTHRLRPTEGGQLFFTDVEHGDFWNEMSSLDTLSWVVGRRIKPEDVAAVVLRVRGGSLRFLGPDRDGKLQQLAACIDELFLIRHGFKAVAGARPSYERGEVRLTQIAEREIRVGSARHLAGRVPLWRLNYGEYWCTAVLVEDLPEWVFK